MGFLLKEALKTLCSRNQWSYAVFWKIGCHNSKLLIWEECYYEPLVCPFPPPIFGSSSLTYQNGEECWFSSESRSSKPGIQEEDIVCSLINKMAVNNSVHVAGEGIIGRAAFTGNHQWILLNNFGRDVYPPEVYAEVHPQFSAGMQTVVVIPVLPHGVVQLGSFLPIMENIGFVNDVKSLILQLGCVPGALLSEDYSEKLSFDANGSNQQSNASLASRPHVQTQFQGSGSIPQTHNPSQISSGFCQPKSIPMIKSDFAVQSENRVVVAEVIPSNLGSCLQQHSVSYNARYAFSDLSGFGRSGLSDSNVKYMEQQVMPVIGSRDSVNPSVNASSSVNMSQLKTDGGHVLDHGQNSSSTSLLAGIPVHGELSSILRTNLFTGSCSKTPKESASGLSEAIDAGVGLQNDDSTKPGIFSFASLTSQSGTYSMPPEGSDQKLLRVDLKRPHGALDSTDQRIEENLLLSGQIPGQSAMKNAEHEQVCAQPSSGGDDLFDVLGVDFKNQLLSGNWNKLFADESDANAENMDKKALCTNMQAINPDCYSVNEAISDSGVFSGTGTDHLLDAVVSRAKSVVIQNSDEMSCRTTLTSSASSVPSHAYRQVMPDHFEGRMFDFPKSRGNTGAVETSSIRSKCSKDGAGNFSQATSIYGSQLSSWTENRSNVKRENSVSTGYSKRPDEGCKPNRKRLKPGENPRPRPKDRQMVQDRVKELREIVPNGAKCSIDALLERTIKHMLFLQSVTKHADKLKQTAESKIISKEGGLLLKDNFEGGATWAYEVGSQSMVCPIIIEEDLNHPHQMLVEMLCEERGFFLEIADSIRGLGLTILKGVMEAKNNKIWARFAVEANRDVTRMEIFMSLVRLLEQTAKGGASSPIAAENNMTAYHTFPQAVQIPATGRPSSSLHRTTS